MKNKVFGYKTLQNYINYHRNYRRKNKSLIKAKRILIKQKFPQGWISRCINRKKIGYGYFWKNMEDYNVSKS